MIHHVLNKNNFKFAEPLDSGSAQLGTITYPKVIYNQKIQM